MFSNMQQCKPAVKSYTLPLS